MIYGPYAAVEEWASMRFRQMDKHITAIDGTRHHGYGVHDETFLYHTTLPNIRKMGYEIKEDRGICFLRARQGNLVQLNDCGMGKTLANKEAVMNLAHNRECAMKLQWPSMLHWRFIVLLYC